MSRDLDGIHVFAVCGSFRSSVIYLLLVRSWDYVLGCQVDKRAGFFLAGW